MSEHLDDFPPLTVAVVTFAPVEELATHRRRLGLPFVVLSDPDRDLYRRFGFGRGSLTEIWSLGTLRLYRDLLRTGRRLRLPQHDTRQLGGDVVIDRDRRVVATFRPRSPDQRPSVNELVAAVERAT